MTAPVVVVAGALIDNGALLIAQRARPAEVAGLWELPGGKVDAGESDADALVRELREELLIEVRVGRRVGADVRLRPDLILRAYQVELVRGVPTAVEHRALARVRRAELSGVDWVPADREWVPALSALLAR